MDTARRPIGNARDSFRTTLAALHPSPTQRRRPVVRDGVVAFVPDERPVAPQPRRQLDIAAARRRDLVGVPLARSHHRLRVNWAGRGRRVPPNDPLSYILPETVNRGWRAGDPRFVTNRQGDGETRRQGDCKPLVSLSP